MKRTRKNEQETPPDVEKSNYIRGSCSEKTKPDSLKAVRAVKTKKRGRRSRRLLAVPPADFPLSGFSAALFRGFQSGFPCHPGCFPVQTFRRERPDESGPALHNLIQLPQVADLPVNPQIPRSGQPFWIVPAAGQAGVVGAADIGRDGVADHQAVLL